MSVMLSKILLLHMVSFKTILLLLLLLLLRFRVRSFMLVLVLVLVVFMLEVVPMLLMV